MSAESPNNLTIKLVVRGEGTMTPKPVEPVTETEPDHG
jgi:hypothetical protein